MTTRTAATTTATTRPTGPPRVPASPDPAGQPGPGRHAALELLVVVGAVAAYFGSRGLTESDPAPAVAHAHQVVALEQQVGLYREPALQRTVLPHDGLLDALNWVYIWGHWPVIAAVLVWLLRSRRPAFRVLRDALVISGALGLVVFVLYPVAPPRLAGLGLLDTVAERSHAYRVLQPPMFVNQYAAVPSLHVGWDLLMGITLVRYARHLLLRVVGVVLPFTMVAAVVLTANHYLVDGAAGAVVALTGYAAATARARRRARSRPTAGPRVAVPQPRAASSTS